MVTPFKIALLFVAFLVGCVTWGRINLAGRFLLSTGGIDSPKLIKSLNLWNLALGFFNLVPIPPLDGGHALEAILLSAGANIYIPEIPGFMGVILFVAYYAIASNQDTRVLEEPGSTIDELRETTASQIKGFDPKSPEFVKELLRDKGLSLKPERYNSD